MASFVPSPTGSSSLSTSPNLCRNLQMVHVQTKRQGAFDENSIQMEEVKADMNMVDFSETTSFGRPTSRSHSLSPSTGLTSLSPSGISPSTGRATLDGVSIEHRMISDLRNQLDNQASENSKLRQQIESATSRQTYVPPSMTSSTTPTLNHGLVPRSFSDSYVSVTPTVRETVESILARGKRSPVDPVPLHAHTESATGVLLRKQLSDAKAEISILTERLKNAESSIEQQKAHFRSAIEELQARLNETIVGRDSVLDLRKKESEGQEKMISQLQKSLKDLDAVNRQHEKSLLEANHRADSVQQTASTFSSALQQIRTLLSSQQPHPSGSLHYPSPPLPGVDSTRNLPPSHVVRLVEEGLRGRLETIRDLERAVSDLKTELAGVRKETEEKTTALIVENREKLLHVTEDHNKQLESLTERATNARQQAAGLQTQLAALQEQSTKQLSLKTMELGTLTGQYEALKREADKERQQAHQKIDELTSELDATRDNMNATREEISKLQLKLADANLTLQSNKETISSLNTQLEEEKEKTGHLRSQDGQRLTNIQRELEARSLEVRHMQEMLEAEREQARNVLRQKIVEVQCEEQKKAVDKTSQLLTDIESHQSEKNKLSLELTKKNNDLEQANESRDRLAAVLEETSAKLESMQDAQGNMEKQLAEKSKMIDILTQERDHYQQMSMERIKELDSATSLQNRLQGQLTEREHEYQMVYQEKMNLTQVIESNERISSDARQEKDSFIKLLDEKTKQLAEVKGLKDDLNRKLKVNEKRVQSLELEVKTLSEAIQDKHGEVEKVIEGKAGLLEELKIFQQKATKLTSEKEILESRYQELEASHEKTRSNLELRIQGLEHDLQLTLQALRATKSADARAVDIADSVQQELLSKRNQVDFLQIKIHGLEESLSGTMKEKSVLETEKNVLEEQVSKLNEQMERFQRKLRSLSDKKTSQKDMVTKLEAALEKAALKHTDAQRLIEEQEQAITKMTLRHQLELKALQRALATRSHPSKTTPNQSSSLSTQRTTTVEKVQTSESATTLTKIQQQSSGKSSAGGVVASHFVRSASVQALDGLVGRNYISPIPVVVMNRSGIQADSSQNRLETSGEEAHNVSSELKDLLEEVKSVFSANMAALKDTHSTHKKETSHSNGIDRIHASEKLDQVQGTDEHVDPVKDMHLGPPETEGILDPPLLTSSPYKLESENMPPPDNNYLTSKDYELHMPSSPVTNLLGLHGNVRSDSDLLQVRGRSTKQLEREMSHRPVGNKAQIHGGNNGDVVGTHSGNATVRGVATKSYSVNRPGMHISTDVVHGSNPKEIGQTGGVYQGIHRNAKFQDANKLATNHVSKEPAFRNSVRYSHDTAPMPKDTSAPLTVEIAAPGYFPTRGDGLGENLEVLNRRNRINTGYGDVDTPTELIITDDDDDNSSITTVSSYSTDALTSDQADRTDSLKGLKERLVALSQMGTQLQKGNKEMAGLIKRQDAKLKLCRQEEQSAKRIINSR